MLVQRVLMPASSQSWTVLGDDDLPVGPARRVSSRRSCRFSP